MPPAPLDAKSEAPLTGSEVAMPLSISNCQPCGRCSRAILWLAVVPPFDCLPCHEKENDRHGDSNNRHPKVEPANLEPVAPKLTSQKAIAKSAEDCRHGRATSFLANPLAQAPGPHNREINQRDVDPNRGHPSRRTLGTAQHRPSAERHLAKRRTAFPEPPKERRQRRLASACAAETAFFCPNHP